ncbi:MAG: Ion transport protein [Gammaproteobacteria bacterium]|nr:MAG: Ion transport protein [Gammaproteobacteria bacterium]
MPTISPSLRKRIAVILDDDSRHLLSRWVNLFIIATIIVTVISIMLESVPELEARFSPVFYAIEYFSLLVFGVEYVCRVWTAPDTQAYTGQRAYKARLKYVVTPMAVIDLLAILPPILSLFAIDLRFLRVIRLLRIFKLTRYNSAMNMLLKVIKKESKAFFSVVFVFIIVLIIASSCIYLLEHKVQPEVFGSIPKSMWWSMVTLATVGYGDAIPITPLGKLFGGLIMLVGIGIVALPAGILASAFSAQLRQNKSSFRTAVRNALRDGVISPKEYAELKELQEKYDLSAEDAKEIIQTQFNRLARNKKMAKHQCPHCGKLI